MSEILLQRQSLFSSSSFCMSQALLRSRYRGHFFGCDTNNSGPTYSKLTINSPDGNLPYDFCLVLQTLCEIQAAMLERGVTQHENITRQIMGNELRHIGNSSYRNVRDWIIFRDCMNGLDYVIQVFEYFKQKLMKP